MSRNRAMFALVLTGVVIPALQIAYYAPRLPERVASHFGPFGAADGWMSKGAFLSVYAVLAALTVFPILGIGSLLERTPNELINLPNKEYWLAPERRRATFAAIRQELFAFGTATMLLLVAIMQMVLEVNRVGKESIGTSPLLMVVAYLVYTGFWCVGLTRRFARPR